MLIQERTHKKHALRRVIWAATNSACSLIAMKTRDTSLDLDHHGTFRTHDASEPVLQQTHANNRPHVQLLCFGSYICVFIAAFNVFIRTYA